MLPEPLRNINYDKLNKKQARKFINDNYDAIYTAVNLELNIPQPKLKIFPNSEKFSNYYEQKYEKSSLNVAAAYDYLENIILINLDFHKKDGDCFTTILHELWHCHEKQNDVPFYPNIPADFYFQTKYYFIDRFRKHYKETEISGILNYLYHPYERWAYAFNEAVLQSPVRSICREWIKELFEVDTDNVFNNLIGNIKY